jgi:hypothetical protein
MGEPQPGLVDRVAGKARYAWSWAPRLAPDAVRSWRTQLPGGERRIYYVHLKKTGGTSLARSFLSLGGEPVDQVYNRVVGAAPAATTSGGRTYVFLDRRAIERGHYFFAWSHLPRWDLELPPRTFTVSVLRDPMARVLSFYRYLSDERADEGLVNTPGGFRRVAEGGFASFLDRLDRRNLLQHLYMFSPRWDPAEAADRIRGLSAWFFTESYAEGLRGLSARLGLDLPERFDRVSVGDYRPTPEETAVLAERLAPEYELLARLRADPGPGLLGALPEGVRA